jgi:hypothetical protein
VGSLSQFEEYTDPLLRAHLNTGNDVGGIGFFKAVKNSDYFLHILILLWLSVAGAVPAGEGPDLKSWIG